jgi:hypothetical protein
MPLARFENAKKLAQRSTGLQHYRSAAAPSIAVKAVLARSVYSIELSRFLVVGLHAQRIRRWRDSMSYLVDLELGLRTLNGQGHGKRLTVDNRAMAERFATAGIPAAKLLAVIGRGRVAHPHEDLFSILTDAADLAAWLAGAPSRLVVKPATGKRGDGILGPARHGVAAGRTAVLRSSACAASACQDAAKRSTGADAHPQPSRSYADRRRARSQYRIYTALTIAGPAVIFVFAKNMGSKCLVDNFAGGKFGNMLACVDKQSGRIPCVRPQARSDISDGTDQPSPRHRGTAHRLPATAVARCARARRTYCRRMSGMRR